MPWNPAKPLLQVQIDPDLFQQLDELAKTEGKSRAALVREILAQEIHRRKEK